MDLKQFNRLTVSQIPTGLSLQKRKIFVEEVYQDSQSNSTFIRKTNCEEIYDHQKKQLSINLVQNASSKSDECTVKGINFRRFLQSTGFDNCGMKKATHLNEETPMEIDSSSDKLTVNANKVRRMNRNKLQNRISKKIEAYSNIIPITEPKISRFSTIALISCLLLASIAIYIVIASDRFIYVNNYVQLQNIKKDLEEYVIEQEEAVKIVIKSFERMDSWGEGLKILPFIGTTGVGKTFTVNIIKKHFYPQLVHEVQLVSTVNIIANLNSCCCNLIIIDNLKASDLEKFINFVDSLPKSFVLLIIPIFNIQDTNDGLIYTVNEGDLKLIRDELENSRLHYELVLFHTLKSRVIEKWLRDELHKRHVSESRHDSLVKFLLDNNRVKEKGFKGLNSQLLLALDNNN